MDKLEHVEEHYKPRNILTLKEINALYEATFQQSHFTTPRAKAIAKSDITKGQGHARDILRLRAKKKRRDQPER